MSGLRSSMHLSGSHGDQDVRLMMAVRKHLLITNMIILNKFGFKKCLKNSIPGNVRAQVLQELVGGSHGDQDGPDCPETPSNYQYDHT